MSRRPPATAAWLLAGALAIGPASPAWSFQLRIAPAADETACGWDYGDCGDDEVFARWFNYLVNYRINNDAAADLDDPDLVQADIIGAVDASFQSWEDVPNAIIRFANAGGTDNRISALDFVNVTLFYDADQDDDECAAGYLGEASGTFAMTISTIKSTGEIVDVDVVVDSAEDWDWDDTDCVGLDLQSTLTHEYGHMVGFGHSDVCPADGTNRPTMCQNAGICDTGSKSRRTLAPDDQAALQCLYPELPTLIVVDQTGSMAANTRMADAKAEANAFVDDYATNQMAVAGLADAAAACPGRLGYELLQDWTDNAALLHAAINGTSACGLTPLWEASCCAITEAETMSPSNLLVFTDTGENNSNGDCGGCTTFSDVLATATGTGVAVYVVDMTNYVGALATASASGSEDGGSGIQSDSDSLAILAQKTGGLYLRADTRSQLMAARMQIARHMAQNGQRRQVPPRCSPGPYPIDAIQRYTLACAPNSPYTGQQVTVYGRVTVPRGPFDAATLYIEDCSGGIQVFMTGGPSPSVGDSVRVVGTVGSVSGGEVRVSSVSSFQLLGPRPQPPLPVEDIPVGRRCEMLGRLIRVQGFVGGPVANSVLPLVSARSIVDPDTLPVFLDPDTGINPGMFTLGRYLAITGILTRRQNRNELKPRFPSDVMAIPVAVDPGPGGTPGVSGIRSIQPNPSRGRVEISFYLARPGRASVAIYDVAGRLVRSLLDEQRPGGEHRVIWDGRDARGAANRAAVYYARFRGPEGERQVRPVVIVR